MHEVLHTPKGELLIGRFCQVTIIMDFAEWSAEAWSLHCDQAMQLIEKHGIGRGCIVYSTAATPTSSQRREMEERTGPWLKAAAHPLQIAVITENMLARGAITAFSWLVPGKITLRAFSRAALHAGAEWLAPSVGATADEIAAAFRAQLQFGLELRSQAQPGAIPG